MGPGGSRRGTQFEIKPNFFGSIRGAVPLGCEHDDKFHALVLARMGGEAGDTLNLGRDKDWKNQQKSNQQARPLWLELAGLVPLHPHTVSAKSSGIDGIDLRRT